MADRNAIRDIAIERYTVKIKRDVTWAQTVAAFQNATPAERAAFAASIYGTGSPRQIAQGILDPYLTNEATLAVDAAMADDMFDLDEFEMIFM